MVPTRRLGTLDQAADLLGFRNPITIRRYIAAGRLTAFRVGPRALRVDLNEVEALAQPIPTAQVGEIVGRA